MTPQEGALRIQRPDGTDILLLAAKHRTHAVMANKTLCGHDVTPSWMRFGPLARVGQLTCEPCITTAFWLARVNPDGTVS